MSRTTHRLCDACLDVCVRHGRLTHKVTEEETGNHLCCGCATRPGTTYAFHMTEAPEGFMCGGFHEGDELAPPVVRP